MGKSAIARAADRQVDDSSARVRERALVEARDHINVLLKELAADRAELRSREARIADLERQVEGYRQQLALVVTRAVARNVLAGMDNERLPASHRA